MSTRDLTRFRRATATALRDDATRAERRIWRALERIVVPGTHFRRQVPLGPYVADFACLGHRLVIELDGGHHNEGDQAARDAARTAWLEREGYRVLRFWNAAVFEDMASVLDTIHAALHGGPDAEPRAPTAVRTRKAPRSTSPLRGEVGAERRVGVGAPTPAEEGASRGQGLAPRLTGRPRRPHPTPARRADPPPQEEGGHVSTSPLRGEVGAERRVGVGAPTPAEEGASRGEGLAPHLTEGPRRPHPTPALRADPPPQGEGDSRAPCETP